MSYSIDIAYNKLENEILRLNGEGFTVVKSELSYDKRYTLYYSRHKTMVFPERQLAVYLTALKTHIASDILNKFFSHT